MTEDKVKSEVTGDESVPYENWIEYEKAVEEGKEIILELPKQRPNERYAFSVDEAPPETSDFTLSSAISHLSIYHLCLYS